MAVTQFAGNGIAGDTLYSKMSTAADRNGIITPAIRKTNIFSLASDFSDFLIKSIQDYFQYEETCRDINVKLAKVNKQITVLDQYALDTIGLPQIVVASNPVKHSAHSFGNRMGTEEYNGQLFEVWGGRANISSNIEIWDTGKPNVEELADLLFLGLSTDINNSLMVQNVFLDIAAISYTNAKRSNMRIGGETFVITMSVPATSEWRQYIEHAPLEGEEIRQTIITE